MKHAVTFIDHKEARVFDIDPAKVAEPTAAVALHHLHRKHPKSADGDKEHPDDAKRFFHEVARALDGFDEILVVGPSTAKLEFLRYVHKNDHALEPKIIGIETVDHPTDGQLVAHAKAYFKLPTRL